MAVVMSNDGLRWALWLVKVGLAELLCHLFVNDWVPSQTDLFSNYVVASFPGYKPQAPVSWSNPYLNSSQQGETDNQILTWKTTAAPMPPQTIYGYVLVTNSLQLIAAERTEPSGFVLFQGGQSYGLQLSFTQANLP